MRVYRGRFQNPNEPETGVNLREHVRYEDTMGQAIQTGERGHESVPKDWAQNGYRVIARRPRSEIHEESVSPERADDIEAFTNGIMPLDRW